MVTFMTNSVGESRHVGNSMIHFNSIFSYAVISLIVQIHAHMHTCDKPFEYQSFKSIYIYIYIHTYIYILQLAFIPDHNRILSSYPLCKTNISITIIQINIYICLYIYCTISIHNRSYHISIPISLSNYLFKDILNLCTYFIYSFLYSLTYTHSRILIHKFI